jgi:hypothetical protein
MPLSPADQQYAHELAAGLTQADLEGSWAGDEAARTRLLQVFVQSYEAVDTDGVQEVLIARMDELSGRETDGPPPNNIPPRGEPT